MITAAAEIAARALAVYELPGVAATRARVPLIAAVADPGVGSGIAGIAGWVVAEFEQPAVAAIRVEAPANQVVSDSQAGPAIVVSAAGSGLRVAAAILARAPLTAAVADPAVACWAEQVVSFDRATGVLVMAAA